MEDSAFGRIVSVLFNPTRTFASIRERPTWLIPLVVLLAVAMLATLFVVQKVDWVEVSGH